MASTTSKRGLNKPARTDYVNVITDLNNNMDNLDNAVPDSRTVNGHALSSDVTVTKADLGLDNVDNVKQVPVTRTVNGHALSSDVTVSKGDVGLGNVDNVQQVPATRKVNNKALSSDVTLYGSDIAMNSLDGTKLDAAISDTKSALNFTKEGLILFEDEQKVDLKRGTLVNGIYNPANNTYNSSYMYRVGTLTELVFPYDITITIADGFKFYFYEFYNGAWVGQGWKTGTWDISANKPFYFQLARVTENTSEIADIDTFVSKFTITGNPQLIAKGKNDQNYHRGSGKRIMSAGAVVAPYNDLDTIPMNEVVTYVITSGMTVSHTPGFNNFVVITMSDQTDNTVGGTMQIAYRIDGTFGIAYRNRWGGQADYNDWKQIASTDAIASAKSEIEGKTIVSLNKIIQNQSGAVSPYDDLNTLPNDSIVTYVGASSLSIGNIPTFSSFTIMTFATTPNGSQGGKMQVAYRCDGTFGIAVRSYWGTAQGLAWTSWKYVVDEGRIASIENALNPFTSLSCFRRVGVIGDSFASGWLNVSGSAKDWYNVSWIQQLARMYGFTGINFSKGGLSARTWLTDAKGKSLLISEDPCELYYIALGINDMGIYTEDSSYLGTSADCKSYGVSHPDTFYGDMGEIITTIQHDKPNAKIILSTMPYYSTNANKFNDAIIAMAGIYEVPYIVQRDDSFFTSSFYHDHMVGYHPTVLLYGGMAKAIDRLTNRCMIDNETYFNDIYPTSDN